MVYFFVCLKYIVMDLILNSFLLRLQMYIPAVILSANNVRQLPLKICASLILVTLIIFLRYIPAYNIEHFNLDENYLFMYNSLNQMSITYCASSILVCIMIFLNIFSCILALTAFLWDTNYT